MATKPFDATMKDLFELLPINWPAWLGYSGVKKASLIDADVSTVTAAADKVFRVESDTGNWLLDVEPEARHAADLPDRLLLYNTVLTQRHELPVHSVALLLRREANASNLTGVLVRRHPGEQRPYLVFRYRVIRLWEMPLQQVLTGFLGALPLAMVTDEAEQDLKGVLARIQERLQTEANPELARRLLASTFLLMGLRYPKETVIKLSEGAKSMEASSTYQLIIARGERRILLRLGRDRFGPPDAETLAHIETLDEPDDLEQLCARVHLVSSWQELFDQPAS